MKTTWQRRRTSTAGRRSAGIVVIAMILINTAVATALRPASCDFVCQGGACAYSGCRNGSSCPGGACSFDSCDNPSCPGGNCDFLSCHNPVCGGGGCRFLDPKTTLRDGYCDGGGCVVNGRPFPSRFIGKLTV